MKKLILVSVVILGLTACDNKKNITLVADNITVTANTVTIVEKKSYTSYKSENIGEIPNLSNPVLIGGCGFGGLFKCLYTKGQFVDMLKFTSSASIKKHGEKKIIEFYKNKFKFGYELGKVKSSYLEDNVTILNYPNARIIATKRTIRIPVVIENDSCKIVLPDNINDLLK